VRAGTRATSPTTGAERSGIDAGLPEDCPHGAGGDPDTEPGEFAPDAPVAPAGVLAREPQDQSTDIRVCRERREEDPISRPASRSIDLPP